MSHIRHIRRLAAVLAGLAAILLAWAVSGSAAFAMEVPSGGGSGPRAGAGSGSPVPVRVHTIVAGGMPGWQITLIAIGSALAAATLAVLADRAMTTRRHTAATAG
jgi:hypothetical protein